jgi:hypothetical protein
LHFPLHRKHGVAGKSLDSIEPTAFCRPVARSEGWASARLLSSHQYCLVALALRVAAGFTLRTRTFTFTGATSAPSPHFTGKLVGRLSHARSDRAHIAGCEGARILASHRGFTDALLYNK